MRLHGTLSHRLYSVDMSEAKAGCRASALHAAASALFTVLAACLARLTGCGRLTENTSVVRTLTIILDDGQTLHWNLDFSEHGTLQMGSMSFTAQFPWIRLESCQCPACTLEPQTNPTCPVAEVLAQYARDLADRTSFERVKVHVVEEDGRHVILKSVPLQNVVGELVRLAVYQAGCPVGRKIKPAMVRLPAFPSNNEILQALALYFTLLSKGQRDDLNPEQDQFMQSLHEVFGYLSKRLENAGEGDVYLNAVVIMHSLSMLFSLSAPELIRTAIRELDFW